MPKLKNIKGSLDAYTVIHENKSNVIDLEEKLTRKQPTTNYTPYT